jgi:cysteine-rich repeat protein
MTKGMASWGHGSKWGAWVNLVLASALLLASRTQTAHASSLVTGLGGPRDYGEGVLAANDDGSTAAIDITPIFGPAGINFFGVQYTSLYVNNNGNITFQGPLSTFTPFGITAGSIPIIAAFFADVDTRGTHNPPDSNLVYYDLDTVNQVFTATWDLVGYYSAHTDKLNNFQIRLTARGGDDFDIEFRYDRLEWTTGDASGGSGGLGGSVARAGYSAGDQTNFFEFVESGDQSQMLDLVNRNNQGNPGEFVFEVRNGTPQICGNGVIEGNEECDDGDRIADDGCSPTCGIEACHACSGEPSVCTVVADGTPCDDQNACTTGDTCLSGVCQAGSAGGGSPVVGGLLFASGGAVEVEVLPASAGYVSELHLFSPGPPRFIALSSDVGTVVSLGTFPAGTELIFGIYVRGPGDTFQMGPASRNPDGVPHAAVTAVSAGVSQVGFEDLFGGGDRDYNDVVFEFRGGVSPTSCDDGNPCTDDTCDPAGGCVHDLNPNCVECSLPSDCDDGNPCTDDSCEPISGTCTHTNNADHCDDGFFCTIDDLCSGGTCAGTARDCSGLGDQCNDGVCNESLAECEPQPKMDDTPCTDGSMCTTVDVCRSGSCVGGAPDSCDDGNECTADSCQPITGCAHDKLLRNGLACDDGNFCTERDACSDGICSGVLSGADSDGDGYCDFQEVQAGCNPNDPFEIPPQAVRWAGLPGEGNASANGLLTYGAPAGQRRSRISVGSDPSCATAGVCGPRGFCSAGKISDHCTANVDCNQPANVCRLVVNYGNVSDLRLTEARLNRAPLPGFAAVAPGCSRKVDVNLDPSLRRRRILLIATGSVGGRQTRDRDRFWYVP